jgi:hypothetical protein
LNNWKNQCAPNLGLAQCYSHRRRVGFILHVACPNHGHRRCRCFLTTVHHPRVMTVPWFSVPTCAALALTYNLCELNAEGFPFTFSPSCFRAAPLSTKHHHMNRPLWLSPEVAFAAASSAQARCHSPTSEPVPSASPPACRRWRPPTRTCCRGWPIPSEFLHPPLLS